MKGNTTIAIIVIVVLAAIVGFSIWNSKKSSKTSSDDTMMKEGTPKEEMMEATPEEGSMMNEGDTMMKEGSKTVQLGAIDGSPMPQTGTATLTDTDSGLMVEINIDNGSDVAQPAHIHQGQCPQPGTVTYPLESVVNGKSTTTIAGVTVADLMNSLPLAINVHKSESELSTYTACGNIQ